MGRQLGGSNRVYVHDEHGEVHSFDPGDDVPTWAAKQITNPKAWGDLAPADDGSAAVGEDADGDAGDEADQAGDADGAAKPYPKWRKDELQAEVDRRNKGRSDDDVIVVEGRGTVADFAAALEGDDVAQADQAE